MDSNGNTITDCGSPRVDPRDLSDLKRVCLVSIWKESRQLVIEDRDGPSNCSMLNLLKTRGMWQCDWSTREGPAEQEAGSQGTES